MNYAEEKNTNEGGGSYIITSNPGIDNGKWKYDSFLNTISSNFKEASNNCILAAPLFSTKIAFLISILYFCVNKIVKRTY